MKHLLQAEIRKQEDKLEFILSSETVDRHGTVLKADGWELDSFRKSPVMCFQHNTHSSDPDNFIGTWSNVRVENGKLLGSPLFEPKEVNEKAEKVRLKVEHGTLSAVSVGFIPLEYHWGKKERGEDVDVLYFDRMELLEVSIVGIPSNPDAVKRSFEELIREFPKPEEKQEITDTGRSVFEARLSLLNLNS